MVNQGALVLRPISPPRGFSLIETLVVLALVGILMATVSLGFFHSHKKSLQAHADRLQLLASVVSDRAVLLNRPHRLVIDHKGVWVEEWSRGQWLGQIPPPFHFRPWVEGIELLSEPQVIGFSRMGQSAGAELELGRGADRVRIQLDDGFPAPVAGL